MVGLENWKEIQIVNCRKVSNDFCRFLRISNDFSRFAPILYTFMCTFYINYIWKIWKDVYFIVIRKICIYIIFMLNKTKENYWSERIMIITNNMIIQLKEIFDYPILHVPSYRISLKKNFNCYIELIYKK